MDQRFTVTEQNFQDDRHKPPENVWGTLENYTLHKGRINGMTSWQRTKYFFTSLEG